MSKCITYKDKHYFWEILKWKAFDLYVRSANRLEFRRQSLLVYLQNWVELSSSKFVIYKTVQ